MRPGQGNFKHNNRNRNRGRRQHSGGSGGGGGGGNPLSRVYESNGPDVKVRGTAQTVAEKYLQLGRDAQSAGDNVMAESYYQHAEHYFRILAAAQAYQQQLQQQYRGPEDGDDEGDEGEGGEGEEGGAEAAVERPMAAQTDAEDQPDIMGFEPQRPQGFPPAQQNGHNNNGQNREFRPRNEGGGRYRNRFDRNRDRNQDQQQSGERAENRPPRQPEPAPAAAAAPEAAPAPEAPVANAWSEDSAPSFLRRGSRRPRKERIEEPQDESSGETAES